MLRSDLAQLLDDVRVKCMDACRHSGMPAPVRNEIVRILDLESRDDQARIQELRFLQHAVVIDIPEQRGSREIAQLVWIGIDREHGLAAVVSGAGPSILVLGSDPAQRLRAQELIEQHASTTWDSLLLAVDFKGATVVSHSSEAAA